MNHLLYSLTNRNRGFIWNEFNLDRPFRAAEESPAEKYLRDLFSLRNTATDYYVVAALNTVSAFPALLHLFNDQEQSYDLRYYKMQRDAVLGGQLVPDKNGPPNVRRVPAEWPTFVSMKLVYGSETNALMRMGDEVVPAPFRSVNGVLTVDWPEASGISGGLVPARTWAAGGEVEFVHTPCGYPHAAIAAKLHESQEVYDVLGASDLLSAFAAASRNSAEVVAVVLAGLGLCTKYANA